MSVPVGDLSMGQVVSMLPCKIAPEYLETAKETGGSVQCAFIPNVKGSGPPMMMPLLTAVDASVELKATWEVPGHGSMDSYTYPLKGVARDEVRAELYSRTGAMVSHLVVAPLGGEAGFYARAVQLKAGEPLNVKLTTIPKKFRIGVLYYPLKDVAVPVLAYLPKVYERSEMTSGELKADMYLKIGKMLQETRERKGR